MIRCVKVTNYLGNTITYDLEAPTIDSEFGLLITKIDGLGPPKANINVADLATGDGGFFNSARVDTRNIVIEALYTNAKTVEEARLMSYKLFPIKRKVTIEIVTEHRSAMTEGYVESNEPNIFSDLASCQISIICPDPFFHSSYGDTKVKIASVVPMFYFRYHNPIRTNSTIMGNMKQTPYEEVLWYDGDYDTGFTMKFHFTGTVENITINDNITGEQMFLNYTFTNGHILEVCTEVGKKSVIYYDERDSQNKTNLLRALDKESAWLRLRKGGNRLTFITESGDDNYTIELSVPQLYEGV